MFRQSSEELYSLDPCLGTPERTAVAAAASELQVEQGQLGAAIDPLALPALRLP